MGDSLAKWMKCPSEIRCSKAMASSAGRIPPLSGKVNNQVLIAAPPGGRCLSLEQVSINSGDNWKMETIGVRGFPAGRKEPRRLAAAQPLLSTTVADSYWQVQAGLRIYPFSERLFEVPYDVLVRCVVLPGQVVSEGVDAFLLMPCHDAVGRRA